MSNGNVTIASAAWLVLCFLGLLLAARSVAILRTGSPWTSAGWLLTALYFVLAAGKVGLNWTPPYHAEYVSLGLLTLAFVAAGVRDEPQAEPWYWPSRVGPRGRERRPH